MSLREKIVQDFIKYRLHTAYNTSPAELFVMYDKMVDALNSGEPFQRFLNFEGATTSDGKIRFDRESNYVDPTDKKKNSKKVMVIFKYPVYSHFHNEYTTAMNNLVDAQKNVPDLKE